MLVIILLAANCLLVLTASVLAADDGQNAVPVLPYVSTWGYKLRNQDEFFGVAKLILTNQAGRITGSVTLTTDLSEDPHTHPLERATLNGNELWFRLRDRSMLNEYRGKVLGGQIVTIKGTEAIYWDGRLLYTVDWEARQLSSEPAARSETSNAARDAENARAAKQANSERNSSPPAESSKSSGGNSQAASDNPYTIFFYHTKLPKFGFGDPMAVMARTSSEAEHILDQENPSERARLVPYDLGFPASERRQLGYWVVGWNTMYAQGEGTYVNPTTISARGPFKSLAELVGTKGLRDFATPTMFITIFENDGKPHCDIGQAFAYSKGRWSSQGNYDVPPELAKFHWLTKPYSPGNPDD